MNWLKALGILMGVGASSTAFILVVLKFVFFNDLLGVAILALPFMLLALWVIKTELDKR